MKKILLGIGSIGAILAPISVVVACGDPTGKDANDKLFDIVFKKIENKPAHSQLKEENYVRAEYSKAVKTNGANADTDKFEAIITNIKAPKFSDEQIQEINSLSQKARADKNYGGLIEIN